MLGSPAGPGGAAQRGQWPLAPSAAPCANTFAADGFSKYGVYSLFPGGPAFGSTLYTHASTIGRFASGHLQQGSPFHASHKDSLFPGYTFSAPTPPPCSPYSPIQLDLLKSFNSSIVIHSEPTSAVSRRCEERCCKLGCEEGCSRTAGWGGKVDVKKEPGTPCQVAEVSTSAMPMVKLEVTSPKADGVVVTNGSNIPLGVTLARQRVQHEVIPSPSLPPAGLLTTVNAGSAQIKEVARITEIDSTSSPLGMAATPTMGGSSGGGTLLQCTDDRGAPFAGWPIGPASNSALAQPTLWQYPTASVPVEPMVPLPFPPVGLQLVREPTTGGFLLLPTTTGIEPLQQTVVWPSYHQPSSVFLPPIPPPPLQLLSSGTSDYLHTGTTLHHHTQTHSTRFVAVTTDSKRKIPLPIPATTLIKIETDTSNLDQSKSLQTVSTVGTNTGSVYADQNMPPLVTTHVIYQHPTNLILSQPTNETMCKNQATSPVTCLTPPPENLSTQEEEPCVQDASNQTDTPICSEDDNTTHTISDAIGESKYRMVEDVEDRESSNDIPTEECIPAENIVGPKIIELPISVPEYNTGVQEPEIVSNITYHLPEPTDTSSPIVSSSDSELIEKNETAQDLTVSSKVNPDLSGLELLSNSIVELEKFNAKKCESDLVEEIGTRTNESIDADQDQTVVAVTSGSEVSNKPTDVLGGLDLLCALAEQRILEEKLEKPKKKDKSKEGKKEKRKSKKHSDEPKRKKYKLDKYAKYENDSNNCNAKMSAIASTDVICKCHQEEHLRTYKNLESEQEVKKFIASKSHLAICDDDWPSMNAMELDMRMKLADLQRQYREKQKELSKLKPKKHSYECAKKKMRKKSTQSDRSTPPPILEKISVPLKQKVKEFIKPPTLKAFGEMSPESPIPKFDTFSASEDMDCSPEKSSSKKRKVGRPKKLLSSPGLPRATTETIVAKKPKKNNFVGYFLAAKEKYQTNLYSDSPPRYIDDPKPKPKKIKNNNSIYDKDFNKSCKIRPKLKAEPTIKSFDSINEDEEEDDSFEDPIEDTIEDLSEDPIEDTIEDSVEDIDMIEATPIPEDEAYSEEIDGNFSESVEADKSMEVLEETEEPEKVEDVRCILTTGHLETDKLRVLTAMGGLFYAGHLNAVEPPDVYSISLDGERGNRPHIMSREEILRDAIVEIAPKTTEELIVGTRICAYWSQQYRCLYPGSVAEPGTPDPVLDSKFVSVEFDDGDSGRIALEDIRLLPPNYPIIEYDPNPLQSLSKRRRRISSSVSTDEKSKVQQSHDVLKVNQSQVEQNETPEKSDQKERKRLKKKKKEKLKKKLLELDKKKKKKHKCKDENCKHKKHHKKHKKHKKHHRDKNTDAKEITESKHSPEKSITEIIEDQDEEQYTSVDTCDTSGEQEISIEEETSLEATENELVEEEPVGNPEDEVTMDDIIEDQKSKKMRDRQESVESRSKMSAFLPARNLWGWAGKEYLTRGKGRFRKSFYKSIQRGKEVITVGDSAVFLSTGRPDRPYIGSIESLWETNNTMIVKVKWFYHPEETTGCPLNLKYPGALFESPHVDENDVQTISHKCEVLPLKEYTQRLGEDPERYSAIYDNNDIYYLAGHYDPISMVLTMEPDIPFTNSD